jgi:hypothetical protein
MNRRADVEDDKDTTSAKISVIPLFASLSFPLTKGGKGVVFVNRHEDIANLPSRRADKLAV